MSGFPRAMAAFPASQRALWAKAGHCRETFVPFQKVEIEQSIPERFEQQLKRHPDRLAVKAGCHAMSYAELNRMANRVANAILARPGGRAEAVALLLPQGAKMVAAILGVWKTGRCSVPIDLSDPPARVALMLKDAQAGLVITNTKGSSVARTLGRNERNVIDIADLDAGLSDENPCVAVSPDTLAYLIYTSGSTGQPKGVIQNHRNALHVTMNYTNLLRICPEDRLALLYSPNSVASAHVILWALCNGAAIYPFAVWEDGVNRLAGWLIDEQITVYVSTASLFRHFAGALPMAEKFSSLRLVHVAGETIYKADVALYRKHFSRECIFAACLGTTEISLIREFFMDGTSELPTSIVPAGYAVEDTDILLLDDHGREVQAGQVGEIAVKSRYLALGYWRRPDLTRSRFLVDPEGGAERIYLTGDLGRMGADGCLHHMGRKDFQVKIDGHRVEIAEIEATLMDLDEVKEAAVVALEKRPGDRRLAAYVVPNRCPAPTVSELRRHLAEKIPDYMIPSTFTMLDALPLTPTGKVDRRALPDPGRERPELPHPYVGPRTPLEEMLAAMWAEVLDVERVGIRDDFQDLGGHSLAAMSLASRVRGRFHVDVSLRAFFGTPTVAGLATAIVQKLAERAEGGALTRTLEDLRGLSDEDARRLLGDLRA